MMMLTHLRVGIEAFLGVKGQHSRHHHSLGLEEGWKGATVQTLLYRTKIMKYIDCLSIVWYRWKIASLAHILHTKPR